MPGERARSVVQGTRFADIRWVAETGSTNADALALARDGSAEGAVLVADHQTAGRGRRGRTWTAPPGGSLLVSILLRPPSPVADVCTLALGVAVVDAVRAVAGFEPRLKWPNDIVHPGEGPSADRKLGGILAEADWPAGASASGGWRQPAASERTVVVAGLGLNVNWPAELPAELVDLATACNQVAGRDLDREELLGALLVRFDELYGELVRTGDRTTVLGAWRACSATLGRRVRIQLPAGECEGIALDVSDDGHLVLDTPDGRRTFAVGDVVHLR